MNQIYMYQYHAQQVNKVQKYTCSVKALRKMFENPLSFLFFIEIKVTQQNLPY